MFSLSKQSFSSLLILQLIKVSFCSQKYSNSEFEQKQKHRKKKKIKKIKKVFQLFKITVQIADFLFSLKIERIKQK